MSDLAHRLNAAVQEVAYTDLRVHTDVHDLGNEWMRCQPAPMVLKRSLPLVPARLLNSHAYITASSKMDCGYDEMLGCTAHEMEHALDFYAASVMDVIRYGADYLRFEKIRNDTMSLQDRLWLTFFGLQESLLDLQAISRGYGPQLLAFREWRQQQNHIDPQKDRSHLYLNPDQIGFFLDMPGAVLDYAEAIQRVLGITHRKPLGLPKASLVGDAEVCKEATILFDHLQHPI